MVEGLIAEVAQRILATDPAVTSLEEARRLALRRIFHPRNRGVGKILHSLQASQRTEWGVLAS